MLSRLIKSLPTVLAAALLSACAGGAAHTGTRPNGTLPSSEGQNTDRQVDALFNYYYHDWIDGYSGGRWTVDNTSGHTFWHLASNPAFSPPKAWLIGGNYWNNENDTLTSQTWSVPANKERTKLGFMSRWNIAEGDSGQVQYSQNGGNWTTLATYTGGTNPGYPSWTRYTYGLPDPGSSDATYQVRFVFTSDGSATSWGWGIDDFVSYQTRIPPPLNVQASDGTNSDGITVTWNHNNDGQRAAFYDIYVSTTPGGPYTLVDSVAYPASTFDDFTEINGITYYYVVRGRHSGFDDSVNSNEDSGFFGQGA